MQTLSIDNDFLKIKEQPKIMQICEDAEIIFSDKIKKINQNEWTQDRALVITPSKIFNIHNKKCKRAIEIKDLEGISRNVVGKKAEFTIHIAKPEYDYRFNSDK
jgi:hypothetical protein